MRLKYNDASHGYWLDGVRCKSVTTIAKIPDDTFALDRWRQRQVALGMALEPQLVERAAAHYDDRYQLDSIAEEAMKAARAHEQAARGTAAHRITERVDLEERLIDTPLARAVRDAWLGALKNAGLRIEPNYIERILVYPEERICGRMDRFVYNTRTKKMMVLDLKTGSGAVRYPHAIAAQLALYVHAPLMAAPFSPGDDATDQFEKLPELDEKWGVIIHMPADDVVEVHKVDIAAGWDTVKHIIFPTLKWRQHDDLTRPMAALPVVHGPASQERVTWIRGRLALLAMMGTDAKQLMAFRWPVPVPTKPPWTEMDVSEIDGALTSVENDMSMPFPTPDPRLATVTPLNERRTENVVTTL